MPTANSPNLLPAWICSQIGAREHYAIPRALQYGRRSVVFYTDFWAGPMVRRLAVGKLRPLGARRHPDLENTGTTTIKTWNLRALFWEKRLRNIATSQTSYHGFIEIGRRFAMCVRRDLEQREELPPSSIFYAYDTGALESFDWCRGHGIQCVLNQMDPNRVEVDMVREEEQCWPGWALQSVRVPEEYFSRREQEWSLADRIIVNSKFSRQALLRQGVPAEKLVTIPLCFEAGEANHKSKIASLKSGEPLRVLFLGQVILRKGIQYLLGAARQLERENIHFDVVGPVGISREALATAPRNVVFHGRIGRDQAAACYQRAHVFVLPTVSDGFAITQLEAMALGLPVVTTPNCGEVVSDGVDGWIIPARDDQALAQALARYLTQPGLLPAQSAAALMKAQQFTLKRLADNLIGLETILKAETPKIKCVNCEG